MKLREFIQSATKKIVLENEVPQTIGFNPRPDYGRGTIGDLSKSFAPEEKTSEAAGGDFLDLAKDIEAKFGGVFSEDLKAIYDGLKNVWSHIRPPKGRPSYSLGQASQEGAIQVMFTLGKEIRNDIQSLRKALLRSPFLVITSKTPEGMVLTNARKILQLYLKKLKNKVEEFENILTSGFEEQPKVGFEESKIRKIIKEEIDKIFNGGIGERIFSRIQDSVPYNISHHLIPRLRAIENEEEMIEAFDDFLDAAQIPFLPEEWDAGVFQSLSDHLDHIATEKQNAPPEEWSQW